MSKIGKRLIKLPEKVEVVFKDGELLVKGPRGELTVKVLPQVTVKVEDGHVVVRPNEQMKDEPNVGAFWGLIRSLVSNAVQGVSEGYLKELELVGVGYRVQKKGMGLELEVGYSHSITVDPVDGITLDVEKGVVRVGGIDKQKVGQVAANIRAVRPPERYKGKGIRYLGEVVRLKPGKSAKVGGA